MSANTGQRLPKGGRINRQQTLQFTFNGRSYQGLAGDTLASALLANGVKMVARSWKYHRPRGILSAGVEEPNALVQLFDGARTVPNARMTEVSLVNGMTASSIHAKPSIEFDLGSVNSWFARLIPAGFYYKTFMSSQKAWHFFEHHIRKASGLGESPTQEDPDRYDKRFAFCDVLVVGSGLAGLNAALAAGATGARVIFADEQAEMGGWLLSSDAMIDGMPATQWVEDALLRLKAMPEVKVMSRTTVFGYMDHNLLILAERRTDHLVAPQATARERLWKVRAKQVVLATGAHERPLVFSNNDLPGIMLASAVSTYIRRYAVLPGQRAVIFTNNDQGYDAAFALKDAGATVTVVDARATPDGDRSARARQQGIEILAGHVVVEASGGKAITGVNLYKLNSQGELAGAAGSRPCDLLAMSGGFSPVIHLHCQSSSKPVWNEEQSSFLPGKPVQAERSAGACHGIEDLAACASDGVKAGLDAAMAAGLSKVAIAIPSISSVKNGSLRPLWEVPHPKPSSRAPKKFVDLQ
nr:(2Fe-2S)-binding protein [Rhodoferax sp.]